LLGLAWCVLVVALFALYGGLLGLAKLAVLLLRLWLRATSAGGI